MKEPEHGLRRGNRQARSGERHGSKIHSRWLRNKGGKADVCVERNDLADNFEAKV